MDIKDTFSYEARWESVGLSCGFCRHQANADEWPNLKRDFRCALHDISLAVELRTSGYINSEWFCRDFEDNGRAYPIAVEHLGDIRAELPEQILFGLYGKDGNLKQIPVEELGNYT